MRSPPYASISRRMSGKVNVRAAGRGRDEFRPKRFTKYADVFDLLSAHGVYLGPLDPEYKG